MASCKTTVTPAAGDSKTTTLWLDAASRVIRVDSDLGQGLETTALFYDGQGRLVREKSDAELLEWTYSAMDIRRTSDVNGTWIIGLDFQQPDRVASEWGPVENPEDMQSNISYGYTPAGLLFGDVGRTWDGAAAHPFSFMYTYDASSRIATAQRMNDAAATRFAYTENGATLTVQLTGGANPRTWTYERDAQGKVIRSAVSTGASATYAYDDAAHTITATTSDSTAVAEGACAPPAVVTAPTLPLPIPYRANTVALPNPAASDLATFTYRAN